MGGVEECGGRGGGMWWEGWRNVVGRVSCVVGGFVLGRCEVCRWGGVDVGGGRMSCRWGR